jgi:dihydroorotase
MPRDGTMLLRGVRLMGAPVVDVLVEGRRLAEIGGRLQADADVVVDCGGFVLLPGLVDLHTHLREPGGEAAETIATGTTAAVAGGFTTVFAMANTDPVTDSRLRWEHVAALATRDGKCEVRPVGAVTTGLQGRELAPIAEMAAAGARLFSDDGRCVEDPALMVAALRTAGRVGAVIAQHAQNSIAANGQINAGTAAMTTGLAPWPPTAEDSVIARDVVLAGAEGAPLHICHLSTAGAVEVVRWAKSRGWPVTAEVTPHHLLLTDDRASTDQDPRFKVNPPLRAAADVAALRAGLLDGTIDVVATDHAPHTLSDKARRWTAAPFGMTGLETALAAVASVLDDEGALDWSFVAELMSRRPAAIGSLHGNRRLVPGELATFCLVDDSADWTVDAAVHAGRSANTPFHGMRFRHRVAATVVAGGVAYDPNELFGRL